MHRPRRILTPLVAAGLLAALQLPRAFGAQLATGPADFVQPGTQPSAAELNDFPSLELIPIEHVQNLGDFL